MADAFDDFSPISRTKLVDSLLPKMLEELKAGIWQGMMPGIRTLMDRYGVSRPPIEQALKSLEQLGYLGAAKSGRGRAILKTRQAKLSHRIVLARPPVAKMTDLTHEVYVQFSRAFHQEDFTEIVIDEAFLHKKGYTKSMVSSTASLAADGAIIPIGLDITLKLMRRLFKAPRPLIMMGGGSDEFSWSIALKASRLIKTLVYTLLVERNTRVCLIELNEDKNTSNKFGDQVAHAYEQAGFEFEMDLYAPEVSGNWTESEIRRIAATGKVDQFLVVRPDAWVAVTTALYQQKMSIPVRCLFSSKLFRLCDSPQSYISVNTRDYVKLTKKWVGQAKSGSIEFVRAEPRYQIII